MPEILTAVNQIGTKTVNVQPDDKISGLMQFRALVINKDLAGNNLKINVYVSDDNIKWRYFSGSVENGKETPGKLNHPGFIVSAELLKNKYIKVELDCEKELLVGFDVSGAEKWQ